MNESNITSLFLEAGDLKAHVFKMPAKNPTLSDPPTHAGKQTDSEVCVHTFTELCLDFRSFCEVWGGSAKGCNTPSNTSRGWLSIDGADVCFCRAPLRNILDSASSSSSSLIKDFDYMLWRSPLCVFVSTSRLFSSVFPCFSRSLSRFCLQQADTQAFYFNKRPCNFPANINRRTNPI